MKLAFSTLPFMNFDAERLRIIAEKYGIDAVEVRTLKDNSFPHGKGLVISNLGSGITIKNYDEKQMEEAAQIFEAAHKNDIPAVRIFLGNFARRWDEPRQELDYEGIVRAVRELAKLELAQVWIETHNEFATGKSLRKLLDDINHPHVKVIWDIIHPIEDEELPQETVDLLQDDIVHVHIKDGIKHPDSMMHDYYYTRLGEGELPIVEIMKILSERGYSGYFSLEWENIWRAELWNSYPTGEDAVEAFVKYMKMLEVDMRQC